MPLFSILGDLSLDVAAQKDESIVNEILQSISRNMKGRRGSSVDMAIQQSESSFWRFLSLVCSSKWGRLCSCSAVPSRLREHLQIGAKARRYESFYSMHNSYYWLLARALQEGNLLETAHLVHPVVDHRFKLYFTGLVCIDLPFINH